MEGGEIASACAMNRQNNATDVKMAALEMAGLATTIVVDDDNADTLPPEDVFPICLFISY
jgi:hypothetical protein